MTLFNCNISEKFKKKEYDICIIGTGLANYPIIKELLIKGKNLNIAIIEMGSLNSYKEYEFTSNSNFIRKDFNQINSGFGGNSNTWANRLMLNNSNDEFFNKLLKDKKNLTKVLKYFNLRSNNFGISHENPDKNFVLNKAIWPSKVLRIQKEKNFIKKLIKKFDLFINFKANHFKIENEKFSILVSNNGINIKSKVFILGCGGVENTKILLRTKAKNNIKFDKYDNIGKYLSDHPKKKILKIKKFNKKFDYLLPKFTLRYKYQLGLNLNNKLINNEKINRINFNFNYELNDKESLKFKFLKEKIKNKKFLNNYNEYIYLIKNIFYEVPKENFNFYYYFLFQKIISKQDKNLNYFVDIFTEQTMERNNFIKLIDLDIDTFKIQNNTDISLENSIDKSMFYFKKFLSNNEFEFQHYEDNLKDASHIIGTTRFSIKPDDGVVDEYCKLHDFKNLFITGSSCFSSVDFTNPTLLIMVQSLKTLDYILKNENSF